MDNKNSVDTSLQQIQIHTMYWTLIRKESCLCQWVLLILIYQLAMENSLTLTHCTQRRRPGRFHCIQVTRSRGGDVGRGRVHDHVLVPWATRTVIPASHIDAPRRRAQTSVRPCGTLIHVQLASRPLERVRARAHIRSYTHAAVQTLLLAHSYIKQTNTILYTTNQYDGMRSINMSV